MGFCSPRHISIIDEGEMEMANTAKPEVQAVYKEYGGGKRFDVTAPGRKTIHIAAPDEASAIAAAGDYWGVCWQAWDFYSSCVVARRA